jgi:hypothetical protein
MIIAVIAIGNFAGDIGGSVHHPVLGWGVTLLILVIVARIIRRSRR